MKRKLFRWALQKAEPKSLKVLLGAVYGLTELVGWKSAAALLYSIHKGE